MEANDAMEALKNVYKRQLNTREQPNQDESVDRKVNTSLDVPKNIGNKTAKRPPNIQTDIKKNPSEERKGYFSDELSV